MSDLPPQPGTGPTPATVIYDGPLWRMFQVRGRHRVAWNQFRSGAQVGARILVLQAATDAVTPFAEIFARSRIIDPSPGSGWSLAGWMPTRELTLLDLGEHPLPTDLTGEVIGNEVDGTWRKSLHASQPVVTLFERAASTLPETPVFNRTLATMPLVVADAATRLGFGIRTY